MRSLLKEVAAARSCGYMTIYGCADPGEPVDEKKCMLKDATYYKQSGERKDRKRGSMDQVDATEMSKYSVVAGHIRHSYVESLYPTSTETAVFTFVREPVARWISGIFYNRKELPKISREDALDMLVGEIGGKEIGESKNVYPRYLLSDAELLLEMSEEENAKKVVERLGELSFVGVVERWDESLTMLGKLLGSRDSSAIRKVLLKYKGKKRNTSRKEGDLDTEGWVQELKSKRPESYDTLVYKLRYEQMIYDEGVRLFDARKKRER